MFTEALRTMMYGHTSISSVPGLLRRGADGDLEPFATRAIGYQRGLKAGLRLGLLMSIVCAEDASRISPLEIPDATRGTYLGDWRVRQQLAACASWPKGDVPSRYAAEVSSTVPSLILSGRFDPVTPPMWGTNQEGRLGNARHFVMQAGHSPWNACIDALVASFIATANPQGMSAGC